MSQHARVVFRRNFSCPGLAPLLDPSSLLPCQEGSWRQEGSQRGQTFPSSAFAQGAPQEHGSGRICTSSSALRIIPAWLRSCVRRSWLPSKLQVLSRCSAAAPAPSLLHPTPNTANSSFLTPLLQGDSSDCEGALAAPARSSHGPWSLCPEGARRGSGLPHQQLDWRQPFMGLEEVPWAAGAGQAGGQRS